MPEKSVCNVLCRYNVLEQKHVQVIKVCNSEFSVEGEIGRKNLINGKNR